MIRHLIPVLRTAIYIAALVSVGAGVIAWIAVSYFGPHMLEDLAWLQPPNLFAFSIAANVIGLFWWACEKTAKSKIVGMHKQTLQDGNLHRIRIDVQNKSFSADKFSVHVWATEDGVIHNFGILSRYAVKTEAVELEVAQYGRNDDFKFELGGGEIKSLYTFSIDSTLLQFVAPSHVMTNMVPFERWRIFVSVDGTNHSRKYEVVHNRTENGLRLYLRSKWRDRFGFNIEAKALPRRNPKKKAKSK